MTLPIYFAWCNPTDTTFGPTFYRMDEDVLAFKRTLKEGDFPSLQLTIRNPRRGLLNGQTWAWLAWNASGTPVPLFFGRLQGLPNDLEKEVITINLLARSQQWLRLKQAAAESLKGTDGYDPIFIAAGNRDDPDSIIEATAAAFHYAHLPVSGDLPVSVSDLIDPEDGYVEFIPPATDPIYDSVEFKIGQQPLLMAGAIATVHWTQRAAGLLDMGSISIGDPTAGPLTKVTPSGFVTVNPGNGQISYIGQAGSYTKSVLVAGTSTTGENIIPVDNTCWTGGSIIDAWPKAGQKLSGGYSVAASFAIGNGAQFGSPQQHNFKWENQDSHHAEADTMSIDNSWTTFPCGGKMLIYDTFVQPGLIDPFASLTLDGPTGVNIPLHVTYSETFVCAWEVSASLALDYEAARPHTETLQFRLNAGAQAVLTDANQPASQDTDIENVPGADVGMPVWNVLSWFTLSTNATAVQLGQVVKSTPLFPGQPIYSIAINNGGTVGGSEPAWSSALGSTVSDGGVTWASLGFTLMSDILPWQDVANSEIALGTVIRAQTFLSAPVDWTGVPIPASPSGTQSFQICVQAGLTSQYTNATFTGLADVRPQYPQPAFSPVIGATTSDNSVVWKSLGNGTPVLEVPLGLDPSQPCYFSTDRGARSIAYQISKQRAKLRSRARIATTRFECPFDQAINITCRMGAHLYDNRLPGGNAFGKVTESVLEMIGDSQVAIATVEFKSCVGLGASTSQGTLVPDYVEIDYDGNYQIITGLTEVPVTGDVFYSLPVSQPDSDGLTFPILDRSQIVVKEAVIRGKPPGAPAFIANSFIKVTDTVTLPEGWGGYTSTTTRYIPVPVGYTPISVPNNYNLFNTGIAVADQIVWFFPITQYYLELKPLDGVSFAKQYAIQTSDLILPMQVDTEATSLA